MVNVSKLSDVVYCQAQRGTCNYTFLPFVDRNNHSVRDKNIFSYNQFNYLRFSAF